MLRFTALQPPPPTLPPLPSHNGGDGLISSSSIPVSDDERNLLVHNLSVLVEWERQRRRACGDLNEHGDFLDDDDENEDGNGSGDNFLQARAKKAAHFATRELEMRETKREREKRKAKLVAESGGLKYTALAMANRSS